MKYTERYFSFPVRIYAAEDDWMVGRIEIPYPFEIAAFRDYYELGEDKFSGTIIELYSGESLICPLKRKEFKELMDKFLVEFDKILEEIKEDDLVLGKK